MGYKHGGRIAAMSAWRRLLWSKHGMLWVDSFYAMFLTTERGSADWDALITDWELFKVWAENPQGPFVVPGMLS